jgi:hypothetical protein
MLNYFKEIITRKKFDRYGNRMETQEIISLKRQKAKSVFPSKTSGLEALGQSII